jgi:hypothetical protein
MALDTQFKKQATEAWSAAASPRKLQNRDVMEPARKLAPDIFKGNLVPAIPDL